MAQYTINLSKVRNYSRRRRAQKAMSILKEEVARREGDEFSVSQDINSYIWSRGAEKPPRNIAVEIVETDDGKLVQLAGQEVEEKQPETSQPEEAEESTGQDYGEVLDGTVGEAKDAINEMEDPDYEKLLELEKQGKDRKTLREFLESKAE